MPSAKRIVGAALPIGIGLVATLLMLMLLGAVSAGAAAAPLSAAAGTTRYVAPTGDDGGGANTCTSSSTPCQTVQHALDLAGAGDDIRVAAGIYTSTVGPVADLTRTVTLQGGWDAAFSQNNPAINPTVLDGQGLEPVVVISATTPSTGAQIAPTLEGLVVTHGRGSGDDCPPGLLSDPPECGGGIKSINADPLIINNVISNNVGGNNAQEGDGGGIFLFGAGATSVISGNVIISNVANLGGQGFGGGIMQRIGQATIQGNQIRQNHDSLAARGFGAGVMLFISPISLLGNDISGNVSSFRGGGIYAQVTGGTLVISGNTILSNTAQAQGGGLQINGNVAALVISNTLAYNQALSTTVGRGGGIRISSDTAGVTITHNELYSNVSAWGGGSGIDLAAPGLVDGNYLHQNQNGPWGAALVLSDTTQPMTAANNVLVDNRGGGIEAIDFGLTVSIVNNTVVGNRPAIGGAPGTGLLIYFDVTPSSAITATVVNNLLANGAACGLDLHNPPAVVSHHNDVWHNTPDYCGGAPSAGNLSVDPRFVNAAAGDYHLLATSPLINAGSNPEAPPTDRDGTRRPQGSIVDIGAFEFIFGHQLRLPVVER